MLDEQNKQITQEDIRDLLEKNFKLTQEIHEMTKRINNYVTFQKIMSFFYLLIIVVPIILSAIYLPPLLKGVFGQYQDLLNPQAGAINNLLK